MAVESGITVNEVLILEVDASPISDPVEAPIGSLALLGDGVSGLMWIKTGGADSAWTKIHQGNVANNQIAFGNAQGDLVGSGSLTWNGSTLAIGGDQTVSGTLGVTGNATVGNLISNGYLRPSDSANTTDGNIRFNGGRLQGRESGVWLNLTEQSYENDTLVATATNAVSTSSSTYITLPNMVLTTPPAGTYVVFFSCEITLAGTFDSANIAVFVGTTQQTASERIIETERESGYKSEVSSLAQVTVNGSQNISIGYLSPDTTVEIEQRTLIALRVA